MVSFKIINIDYKVMVVGFIMDIKNVINLKV